MHTNTLPCVVHDVIVLYVWSRLHAKKVTDIMHACLWIMT